MNKEELLKLLESLKLPKNEYYILGGGSLVMFRNKRYYRRFGFVRFGGIVWNIKKEVQPYWRYEKWMWILSYFRYDRSCTK